MLKVLQNAFAGLVVGLVCLTAWSCIREALANENEDEARVFAAVKQLQPRHPAPVAASWAGIIYEAGREASVDPLLITSIAFRESSLRPDVVGNEDDVPEKRDIGAMQLRGAARRYIPRGCDNPLELSCNIRGGANYLSFCRDRCGGSWNVWVGAYGARSCPSEEVAGDPSTRIGQSVRNARRIYESIGGTGWVAP